MGQLTGRAVRALLTSLDVVSDDSSLVAMFTRQEDGTILLRTRAPHESTWGASGPTFTLHRKDAVTLGQMLLSQDVSYYRDEIDKIPTADFTLPDPNPKTDEAEAARCAELDIERAKAANIAEERELLRLSNLRDHANDKHITADVDGCEACDNRQRSTTIGAPLYELGDPLDPNDPDSVAFGSVGNADAPDA